MLFRSDDGADKRWCGSRDSRHAIDNRSILNLDDGKRRDISGLLILGGRKTDGGIPHDDAFFGKGHRLRRLPLTLGECQEREPQAGQETEEADQQGTWQGAPLHAAAWHAITPPIETGGGRVMGAHNGEARRQGGTKKAYCQASRSFPTTREQILVLKTRSVNLPGKILVFYPKTTFFSLAFLLTIHYTLFCLAYP